MDIYLIVINIVICLHYLSADTGKFLFFISSSIRAQLFRTSLDNEVVNREESLSRLVHVHMKSNVLIFAENMSYCVFAKQWQ